MFVLIWWNWREMNFDCIIHWLSCFVFFFLRLTSSEWYFKKKSNKEKLNKKNHRRTNNKLNFAISFVLPWRFRLFSSHTQNESTEMRTNAIETQTTNNSFIKLKYISRLSLLSFFSFVKLRNLSICNKASSRIFCLFDV